MSVANAKHTVLNPVRAALRCHRSPTETPSRSFKSPEIKKKNCAQVASSSVKNGDRELTTSQIIFQVLNKNAFNPRCLAPSVCVGAGVPRPNVGCPPQVIPYTGPIPGGLHPGEIIIIQGSVPPDADR